MNTVKEISIKDIITESLKRAISYQEYRDLVKQLVEDKSTTGNEKTEALINYTMLNDRRMKRWDKTLKISEDIKEKFSSFDGNVTWLVITESWCGDAAHVIPVLNKIAERTPNIDLKLVFRDENEALMDNFLTNGGRSIAKLIMIDNTTGDVVNTYGPRPTEATKLVIDYKESHGQLTPEFKEDLQSWYNKNKGQNIVQDTLSLLDI
jgi:thiol-disulfide isomerase/thioredoxin